MARLEGRIAVITASGSGIGREAALRMAREGAHVIVTDIDLFAAESVVKEIESAGGSARARRLDVSQRADVKALFEEVEKDQGILHILFNNAGIPGPAGVDITDEEWDRTLNINLRSVFYATEYALPLLRKAAPHASIICTASAAGIKGSAVGILYSATKGAVIQFVKSLAIALGPENIRVNAVAPGSTSTPMLRQFFERGGATAPSDEVVRDFIKNTVPMGRTAEAGEIADAVVFLASDESSFVHGSTISVDGGYLIK
jgi:NAD(P)-dependent dehydrogenase (short-subunit alcohol dehydrogenase family)